jgi:hypothetical protein
MTIEVSIKFSNEQHASESELDLAVKLLTALGAKFPTQADKPTTAADKTKPA